MCDPIGALTLAGTIVATCYDYGCAVADAPREARSLVDETSSLAGLLAGVKALSNASNVAMVALPQVVDDCQLTLQKVMDHLKEYSPDGPFKRLQRKKNRMLWPLRKDATMALIADIERQKNALAIALGASAVKGLDAQAFVLEDVQRSVNEISGQIGAAQVAQERSDILTWLSTYDFAEHHQQACQTYCQRTCLWMLDDPLFKEWLQLSPSSLWLSGSAGSGKTVLTSFVISCLQKCSSPSNAVAYFYCNANTAQSLSTETVLASLLCQLCGPVVPSSLRRMYRQATEITGASRPPTAAMLKSALTDFLQAYGNATIVVDGVDEASDPDGLCEVLYSLTCTPRSRLRLFLSSRPEPGIEAAMLDTPRLTASRIVLEKDIEIYVNHRLAADRRLAKLSDGTRSHIHRALMDKSEGMFRWAQCQLDATSRMRSESAIDAALSSLPKSLQETYQRALDKVSDGDRVYLRRSMLWLTWSLEPLDLNTVVDAIVLEPGMTTFDIRSRLSDPEDLLEICGTFAVYQEDSPHKHKAQQIRLAHHSVRDFFCDGLDRNSQFWLPLKSSHHELAVLCITYLLLEQWTDLAAQGDESMIQEITQNHLLQYAACSWPMHVLQSETEFDLLPLINKLISLAPNAAFFLWIQIIMHCASRSNYAIQTPQPLYYAASYGLKETVKLLISQDADLNIRGGGFGSTALHAACYRRHPEIVRILLDAGCDPRISDNNDMTAIELAVWNQDPDIARELLEKPQSTIFGDQYKSAKDYQMDLIMISQGKRPESKGQSEKQSSKHVRSGLASARKEEND